jgi:hypothetical protein
MHQSENWLSSPVPTAEVGTQNSANEPVDGRGKSPGSRRTQFQPGHGRMGGRRKAKPDLVKLLEQVCNGIRGEEPPQDIETLRAKLEELNQRLNPKPDQVPARSPGAGNPEESKPRPTEASRYLVMQCCGCQGPVSIDRSLLEPGAVFYHACGARIRVGSDRSINWF